MSTKIYTAWRVPKSRLNDAIDYLRGVMDDEGYRQYCRLVDAVDLEKLHKQAEENEEDKWYHEKDIKGKQQIIQGRAIREVEKVIRKFAADKIRAPGLDLECGLNIWIHGNYAYIIPWGELTNKLFRDDTEYPEWLKDYSYWNNTDPPEGMSYAAFRRRGDNWDKAFGGKGDAYYTSRRLTHHVFQADYIDIARYENRWYQEFSDEEGERQGMIGAILDPKEIGSLTIVEQSTD